MPPMATCESEAPVIVGIELFVELVGVSAKTLIELLGFVGVETVGILPVF